MVKIYDEKLEISRCLVHIAKYYQLLFYLQPLFEQDYLKYQKENIEKSTVIQMTTKISWYTQLRAATDYMNKNDTNSTLNQNLVR